MLVVGKQGNYTPVTIDMIDFIHDLAVLRFQKNPRMNQQEFDNFVNKEFSTGLEVVNNYSDVSTKVAYAGFPLGIRLLDQQHNSTYSEGIVSIKMRNDNLRKQIQISGSIVGGFSGAPIVLKDNPAQLLGMISNSPSKEAGDANIFMGISWEHIKAIAKLANS